MDRKLVGAMLLLASNGCRACNSCCDYLPPVVEGPYASSGARVGSASHERDLSEPFDDTELVNPMWEELPTEADP